METSNISGCADCGNPPSIEIRGPVFEIACDSCCSLVTGPELIAALDHWNELQDDNR